MKKVDQQKTLHEALLYALAIGVPGSQTQTRNPKYDWKTGMNPPDVPEYFFGTHSVEDFESACAALAEMIKDISPEFLGPALKSIKQGHYSTDCYELQKEMQTALRLAGFPGFIKDIEATFSFEEKSFAINLWPEGNVAAPFRIPPYTEFLPRWQTFLKVEDSKNLTEFKVTAHWDYQAEQMLFKFEFAEQAKQSVDAIASKDVFKVSKATLFELQKSSEVKVSMDLKLQTSFLKLAVNYSPY